MRKKRKKPVARGGEPTPRDWQRWFTRLADAVEHMMRLPVPRVTKSNRRQAEIEAKVKNHMRQVLVTYLDEETMNELTRRTMR